jgi:N6-adenosine-specific RNA methylase IME4
MKQIVFAPRGAHSSKPEEIRNRIDQVWPSIPKLELFARPPIRTKNWLKLGNEISGNDIREDLRQLATGIYTIPKGD